MFESIVGQERAKNTLYSMVTSGAVPHALLFAGPYGVGKGETAIELAARLLCEKGPAAECGGCSACRRAKKLEHPDLHVLFPFRAPPKTEANRAAWTDDLAAQRKMLSGQSYAPVIYEKGLQVTKDLVNEVRERLLESSFEGGRRICIIFNADKLNPTTANRMLKILEEPPASVHFILTTERISSVLPTIVSRSSVIRFRRLQEDEIRTYLEQHRELGQDKTVSIAQSAGGSIKTAKALAFGDKSALLKHAFELYSEVAAGGPADAVSHAFLFSRSREVVAAEELINGFAIYTKSVLEKKLGISSAGHDIPESSELIQSLSGKTDITSLNRLSVKLEDGLEMLGRNVNISTVMTSIFYGIHDTYR